MKDNIIERCELLKKNRKVIADGSSFENDLMIISAAMIFTGAGIEADPERLKICKKILAEHTGLFSKFRKNTDLVLESRMSLSEDPERYIEEVVEVHKKIRKAGMKDNDFTVVAAMLLCELGKAGKTEEVMERYNELMKRMNREHPVLTDSTDSSYVMLLATSDRDIDLIISDIDECIECFKKTYKTKAGSDAIQGIGEVLALRGGDVQKRCGHIDKLFTSLKEKKAGFSGDREFAVLGALADIDAEPETLVDQIIEASDILKEDKAFSDSSLDKSRRLMFAAALVADCYRDGSAAGDNTYISSALGILKDKATAAMISAVIQALPSIAGAVIPDEKASETDKVSEQ